MESHERMLRTELGNVSLPKKFSSEKNRHSTLTTRFQPIALDSVKNLKIILLRKKPQQLTTCCTIWNMNTCNVIANIAVSPNKNAMGLHGLYTNMLHICIATSHFINEKNNINHLWQLDPKSLVIITYN